MPSFSVEELRQNHPRFTYRTFGITRENNLITISHLFEIEPDLQFHSSVSIPDTQNLDQEQLFKFAFHLGLVEMLSYWKCTCSPEIVIEAGALRDIQLQWWKKLLLQGLGEFFYRNSIDFSVPDFVTLRSTQTNFHTLVNESHQEPTIEEQFSGNLILVSGGKDSSVMLDLLQTEKPVSQLLLVNPTQAAIDQVKIAGYQHPIIVHRSIDPKLLELNKAGYLNGHTPFSAYLAFLGTFVATMFKKKFVVVANEKSASEGNITWQGMPINHQYSKSYGFESAFRSYAKDYLTKDTEYFSILRPIYDLQVAQYFSKLSQYHLAFRSCNVGQKDNVWCGTCPKCAFVYLSLFPFLSFEQVHAIFGSDFFIHPEICEHLRGLVGLEKEKPFECVGTVEESKLAIALSIDKYEREGRPLPPILVELQAELGIRTDETMIRVKDELLNQWSQEHFLPSQFESMLKEKLQHN